MNKGSQNFKFTLPILKTETQTVEKDGKTVVERFVQGVASTTDLDLQRDIVSKEAIKSMEKSLQRHLVKMNDEHKEGWSSEISDSVSLQTDEQYNLIVKARLNGMSRANDLWYALTEANKRLGLSIGGRVLDYDYDVVEKDGEEITVRILKNIDLDHIAVTSRPANPKTWLDAINKSLSDEEDIKLDKDIMKEKKKDALLEATKSEEEEAVEENTKPSEAEDTEATPDNKESTETSKPADDATVEEQDEDATDEEVQSEVDEEAQEDESPEEKAEGENTDPENTEEDSPKDATEEEPTDAEEGGEEEGAVEDEESEDDTEPEEDDAEKSVSSARTLAEMAQHVEYMIESNDRDDKPTKKLKSLLSMLKESVKEEVDKSEDATDTEDDKKDDRTEKTDSAEATEEDTSAVIVKSMEVFKKSVTDLREDVTVIKERLTQLEKEPAERGGVVLDKGIGDSEDGEVHKGKSDKLEALDNELQKELEKLEKEHQRDPDLFSMKRKLRKSYEEKRAKITN